MQTNPRKDLKYMVKYSDSNTIKAILENIQGGNTIQKTCRLSNITTFTFYNWLHTKKQFKVLVDKAQSQAVRVVEDALFKRCLGFEWTEVTEEPVVERHQQDGTDIKILTEKTLTVTKQVKKKVAPDVGAIVFFLCNRAPKKWQNIQFVKHSGAIRTLADLVKDVNGQSKNKDVSGKPD